MNSSVLLMLKSLFRKIGIEVSLYNLGNIYTKQLVQTFKTNNIDVVIDVGANEGQFAMDIIDCGYKDNIISFEPLKEAHHKLMLNSKKYTSWKVFPRMALGDKNSSTIINISENSVSSSILDILPSHTTSAPDSKYIKKEKVPVNKLDTYCNIFRKYDSILLKIDAQGYEDHILNGADKLLDSNNLKGILIEVSFERLYKDQKDFDFIYQKLKKKGFKIWSIEKAFLDMKTGRTLQSDLLLFR